MLAERVRSVVPALMDLLVPPRCGACRERPEHPLCTRCRSGFEPITAPVCARCGLPLSGPPDLVFTCIPCRRRRRPYDAARSYGHYDGTLRDAIHALKFRRRRALAEPLGRLMAEVVLDDPALQGANLVVPVPLHWRRRVGRTYNQAELLAEALARRLGLPPAPLLRRTRHGAPQTGQRDDARRRNVRGAFAVRAPGRVRGMRVLLVDDVMTTGSTIEACARALRSAGARSVAVVTLARTVLR